MDRFELIFNLADLYNVRKRFEKKIKKKFTLDELENNLFKGFKWNLLKDSYKRLIEKAFSKEGLNRKETNNDIIDFTNMCLIEDFAGIPVAFLISEKKWLKYIIKSKDPSLSLTQTFINKYMDPDYLEVIKRN